MITRPTDPRPPLHSFRMKACKLDKVAYKFRLLKDIKFRKSEKVGKSFQDFENNIHQITDAVLDDLYKHSSSKTV